MNLRAQNPIPCHPEASAEGSALRLTKETTFFPPGGNPDGLRGSNVAEQILRCAQDDTSLITPFAK